MALKLYNTYERKTSEFNPIDPKEIRLYTCGQTVYSDAHIGNMRYYIFEDTVRRSLEYLGYKVKHVMNVTDVGHLTGENLGDADAGEDKLEKGARLQNKTVWEVAEHYTKLFLEDLKSLNIKMPHVLSPATQNIPEIIEMVQVLLDKGYAYETPEAIYFDVTKFPKYEQLTGQKFEEKMTGAREEVVTENSKKHPADFSIWFKTVGRFVDHTMRWDSPWGQGFPGWHIECSAISRKYLGQPFDVHTGGVDHITVHHANEIAQSEAAYGVPLSNYWLHSEHLSVEGRKMSKSLENLFTLADLKEKGFSALDFRYLVLTSHYKNRLNFTWDGLRAATQAFSNLRAQVADFTEVSEPDPEFLQKFKQALENNLDTPGILAIIWELIRESKLPNPVKRATINQIDEVLGLDLSSVKTEAIPEHVKDLIEERDQARNLKDWGKSDDLRQKIESLGFIVEDSPEGTKVKAKY